MNKITDTIVATQLTTWVAAALVYSANLIFTGELLNHNWDFAGYLGIIVATIFMLLPYWTADNRTGVHSKDCYWTHLYHTSDMNAFDTDTKFHDNAWVDTVLPYPDAEYKAHHTDMAHQESAPLTDQEYRRFN